MAHELGPALRASCAFVSHIMLAHRVLPHIEDWLPATRTRKSAAIHRYGGNVPCRDPIARNRLPVAPRRSVRGGRTVAGSRTTGGRVLVLTMALARPAAR